MSYFKKAGQMNTNDLYQAAFADREASGERYGVARKVLDNGNEIICSVAPVAGRSIVGKHDRTSFGIIRDGEQYAKPISHDRVAQMLRDHH